MMPVMLPAFISVVLSLAQEPAAPATAAVPEKVDRVFFQDRSELRGEILECAASGRFRIRVAGVERPLEFGLEEVARLRFTTDDARPSAPGGEQIRLVGGGTLSGRVLSFDGETAVIENVAGTLKIRRKDVKALLLSTPEAPLPELRDDRRDILIREVEKKVEGVTKPSRECVADYGFLRSIDEKVKFQSVVSGEAGAADKVEEREYDRASCRHIYLYRESSSREFPTGLFAKVTLKNGDRWVALVQGIDRERVKLFSPLFGVVDLPKGEIHTISFTQQAQLTGGNLVVTDVSGVHEYDARGREIWSFTQGAQGAAIARKLSNGSVLVADPNSSSVYEIRPLGRAGGDIPWRIANVQYPRDACRLENGNTLVTEQYSRRVVEYDAKTREPVWQVQTDYPLNAQRLDNGNTLICTQTSVIEVNRAGAVQWSADLRTTVIRPVRASRLDNGNTLIVDQQNGKVYELDARSSVVWKATGFASPSQAIRLEDGNTLVLESGANRIVEVDPMTAKKNELNIRGLNQPQGMANY
jgi:outer membrane protein assembly factor BamB